MEGMKMSEKRICKYLVLYVICLFLMFCNTGCARYQETKAERVSLPVYSKREYSTTQVKKGDLTPYLKIDLKLKQVRKVSYYPYINDMEVEELLVAKGQSVNAGDKLIQFKDEGISAQISAYEEQIAANNRLIEHYTKLEKLDKSMDLKETIGELNKENDIAAMYVKQLSERLKDYSIFAEEDGVIDDISNKFEIEKVGTEDKIISVIYGDGYYEGDVIGDYSFKEGDVYSVEEDGLKYDFEVISYDAKSGRIQFKLLDLRGMYNRVYFTLKVELEKRKDVLYLPEYCVHGFADNRFVYQLDENGYRYVKNVTVGETIDGNTIICTGLNKEDLVVE